MDVYAWLLIVAMAAGVLGTFVPMVPGMWLVFVSLLVYGVFDHWIAYPIWFVVIVGALAIGSSFLDYYGTMIGAKKFGASNDASIGSTLGSAAGGFIGKGRGSFIGSIVGTVGAEYRTHRSMQGALRASAGSLLGTAVVSLIQFVVALIVFVITVILLWGAA
ncbi:MAG: DUF456 domain-containing protein [Peptococcaceae bacterium]|nr:DUF456 domain-containing protein [Peptococcaceae bacterium]